MVGKKGTIGIKANKIDKFSYDTSRDIYFKSKIIGGPNPFEVDCGFWYASKDKLYVFCNVDNSIPAGNYTLDLPQSHNLNIKIIVLLSNNNRN